MNEQPWALGLVNKPLSMDIFYVPNETHIATFDFNFNCFNRLIKTDVQIKFQEVSFE